MKRSHLILGFLVILLIAAVGSLPLGAQQFYGTITGTVTDATGAMVPNATVKVTNTDTNVTLATRTNSVGLFNVPNLIVGTYRVEADASGFKRAVADKITLEVGATPKVDLTLTIGQSSEVVNVNAANSAVLQTEQTDLGQTLDNSQLVNLPIQGGGIAANGRSPYNLLSLAAGVSQQTGCTNGTGGSSLGACGNEGNVRVSGSRPRTDDNVLDGVAVTAIVFGGPAVTPSIDAIQEFRIEQNSMSAEYGKAGGLIVIQVSKSGTNQFHGSGYEYNRNENWDARNFFADPTLRKNPYSYNDFGGSIGGPIVKGRLFFFSDIERINNHGATVSHGVTVPDSAYRNGDLGAFCTGNGGTFDASGHCSNPSFQIYEPGNAGNASFAIPFNNIANATAIPSAASANFLPLWPSGGTPVGIGTNVMTINPAYHNTNTLVNPRLDLNLSQSDHIFGAFHYDYFNGDSNNIISGPAGAGIARGRQYASTVGWTHTINSATLNEFRFGVSHHLGDRMPFGAGFTSPALLGIPAIPNCLSSIPDTANGTKCGTPSVSVNGYNGFGNGGMLYEPATGFHFSDSLSKLMRKHSLKVGFQADHYAIDNYQPNGVTGGFTFNGKSTNNPLSDFLFGSFSKTANFQGQPVFVSSRAWSYAFFVQDDIKLTPKLTLNAGLRWQYDQSFHETHHGDAFFDPCAIFYSGKDPSCVPHWEQFGVGGTPDATFDPSKHQFEPRLGLSWNPVGGFVVRAGYGIMHPGFVGHGRAGDGQPGPNLLWSSHLSGSVWDTATPACPIPTAADVTAPIPINGCTISFSSWAPRKQHSTYNQLWNFTIQKQIGNGTTAQVGYVGSKGTHLPINYAYNICQQTPASTAGENTPGVFPSFDFVGPLSTPYCPAAAAALNAGAGFSPGPVYFWLTVNPGWWGLSSSMYHSMQAQFEHRFSHNFSMLANFTWSKLIDDSSSDWGGFWSLDVLGQDFYNRKAERSVSAGDLPLRFTVAPVVQLPFGRGQKWLNSGVASNVLGGWRVSTIYTISAGTPFGITDNSYGYCNGAGVLSDRPNLIGNPGSISGSNRNVNLWFNNQAMDFAGTCPGPGLVNSASSTPFACCDVTKAFGNAPRFYSNIRNPGANNVDFDVQKDLKIPGGEQTKLTFEAAIFNLLNHPQFAEPVGDPTIGFFPATATQNAAGFGAISGTSFYSNRIIQLGLHLYF